MGLLCCETCIDTGGMGRAVAGALNRAFVSLTEVGPVAGIMGEAGL
jgi:hypothetical protein